MIVADASVVLKWILSDEEDRDKAIILRQRHILGQDLIAVPDLLLYEVANVLPLKLDDLQQVLEGLQEICEVDLHVHGFEFHELARVVELARHYRISGYDACYLVLSQALRCPFVTADEKLLERLKGIPHVMHLTHVKKA